MESAGSYKGCTRRVISGRDAVKSSLGNASFHFMSGEQNSSENLLAVVLLEKAWNTIAKYIPPSPITYSRLAQVNRLLYKIFLSDALWKELDMYGVKENIHLHYVFNFYHYSQEQRLIVKSAGKVMAEPLRRNRICTRDCVKKTHCIVCQLDCRTQHVSTCSKHNSGSACDACVWVLSKLTVDKPYMCLLAAFNDRECALRVLFCPASVQMYMLLATANGGDGTATWLNSNTTAHITKARHILVQTRGLLQYANGKERKDYNLVLKAVQFDGLQLRYADQVLRSNEIIVREAVRENIKAYEFADVSLDADYYKFEVLTARQQRGVFTLPDL